MTEKTRKAELLEFLCYVPDGQYVAIYYEDKNMQMLHYSIYEYIELETLKEKVRSFKDDLDGDIVKIVGWKSSVFEEYLTGVYDGLNYTYCSESTGAEH